MVKEDEQREARAQGVDSRFAGFRARRDGFAGAFTSMDSEAIKSGLYLGSAFMNAASSPSAIGTKCFSSG